MTTKIRLNNVEAYVIRKSIKNIYLRICIPDGRIRISAPFKLSIGEIKKFALSKIDWIKNQQNKIKNKIKVSPYKYVNNETHYYRGNPYPLKIVFNKFAFAELRNKEILLNIPPGSITEDRKKVMEKWYRNQLMILVPPLIKKWENILNVSVENFFIRRMKTRWGSCTPKSRRIRFNLELAKACPEILEYIVVHELIHLVEASHNSKFKALMDRFYPNWKYYRNELNKINLRT